MIHHDHDNDRNQPEAQAAHRDWHRDRHGHRDCHWQGTPVTRDGHDVTVTRIMATGGPGRGPGPVRA